ncbi:CidA/LrgA family holin-like protein [Paenibacillus wenxiniae]|uniref:CidA/LrgA family holin-like protein n=1 Tax=Paenibacillus wenxiniae TaxID=1636843 RepID=A0ABW4RMZ9_9BACL
MKLLKIIIQIALLYAFAWLGGQIQAWLHLAIPGSIIGLLLLFVLLLCRIIPVSWIEAGSTTILFYLPLFFVPATVGVINHLDLFAGKGLLLVAIVIASTIITIIAAGHASQWLAILTERRRGANESNDTVEGIVSDMHENGHVRVGGQVEQNERAARSDKKVPHAAPSPTNDTAQAKLYGKKGTQL